MPVATGTMEDESGDNLSVDSRVLAGTGDWIPAPYRGTGQALRRNDGGRFLLCPLLLKDYGVVMTNWYKVLRRRIRVVPATGRVLEDEDFRFLTSLRYVRNDRCRGRVKVFKDATCYPFRSSLRSPYYRSQSGGCARMGDSLDATSLSRKEYRPRCDGEHRLL